jgi:putative transposon-encoded protein
MKEELMLSRRKLILSVDVEDILRKEVSPIGNGAHVICPKEHIGKTVYLVIVKNDLFKLRNLAEVPEAGNRGQTAQKGESRSRDRERQTEAQAGAL